MSPSLVAEVAHASAVRAALDVPLGQWSAYDYDDVPTVLPEMYVLISLSRRFGGQSRLDGSTALGGWRLTTLAVGHTVDEARFIRDATAGALSNARLTVTGLLSSPIQFETEQPIAYDDGWFSGITAWTYALL